MGNRGYIKQAMAGFLHLLSSFALALLLLAGANPVHADVLDKAADNWVENHAAKQSDDILRDIEKSIKLDPDIKKNLKDSVKGFLKDKLKKALLPKAHSLAMQEIIDSIEEALNSGTRRRACDTAAVNQAYWAASQVRRQLTGAAETAVDLLESVGGAGSLAKDLVEKAAITIGKKVLDKIRKALEEALDNYLKNYTVETFSRDFSSGGCSMTMRVIWNKGKGQFHYVILGDCKCNLVAARGKHKVRLERWSVTGSGSARWVGEARGKKINKKLVPESTIRGKALTTRIRVKSVCCGSDGTACAVSPSKDPWIFIPSGTTKRPTTGSKGGKPKRPTTGSGTGNKKGGSTVGAVGGTPTPVKPKVPTNPVSGEPLSDDQGKIEVPEIPEGPLCPSDKEKITGKAQKAFFRAGNLVTKMQRDYSVAEQEGKDSAKAKSAKKALEAAEALKEKAGKALEQSYSIPEKKNCHPNHNSQSMIVPDSSGAVAGTQPAALALAVNGPKSCRAGRNCRYGLIVTNDSNALVSGALPLTISTNLAVASVKPRTEGWTCAVDRGGIQCYADSLELAPQDFTGLELDLRFANRSRTTNANICFGPSPIWSNGESGPTANRSTIQLLQHTLTKAGYRPGPVDGQMGKRTKRSAHAYAKRNFCQIPENIVSDDLLAALLGGSVIDGVANQACTSTRVTANRRATKKSSGTSWPGVILKYGIDRELRRRHDRRRHEEEYQNAPKVEPKEVVPRSAPLECTPDGKCY